MTLLIQTPPSLTITVRTSVDQNKKYSVWRKIFEQRQKNQYNENGSKFKCSWVIGKKQGFQSPVKLIEPPVTDIDKFSALRLKGTKYYILNIHDDSSIPFR